MPITVANTTLTNTVDYLIDRVNELASAMSTKVLTIDSNTAFGNTAATGLRANTISGGNSSAIAVLNVVSNVSFSLNNLLFGNSTVNTTINSSMLQLQTATGFVRANGTNLSVGNSTSNITIQVPNTTHVSNGSFFLNANGSYVYVFNTPDTATTGNLTTTGTTAQLLDNFTLTSLQGAEYVITIKDNAANAVQTSKLLLVHNGVDTSESEYGIVFSNTRIASFSANANATVARLYITPTSTNTKVSFIRFGVNV